MAGDKAASLHGMSRLTVGRAAKAGPGAARPDQVVALGILPHAHHLMPPISTPTTICAQLAASSGMLAAASTPAITDGEHSSKAEHETRPDTSFNAQTPRSPLWMLPISLLEEASLTQNVNHQSTSQAGRLAEQGPVTGCEDKQLQNQSRALLLTVLSGTNSAVCFDSQGTVPAAFLAHIWSQSWFCCQSGHTFASVDIGQTELGV